MYDGTNDILYAYDQNGLRVRKTVNGAGYNYRYTDGKLSHLYAPTYGMHFFYDGQGKPSIVKYNGSAYFYLYNLQGDVIGIIDSNGSLVVEYNYDAWGKVLAVTGSMADTLGKRNPLRYRGYFYDEETGLYYLKSRYYNPEWDRFISADVLLRKCGALLSHNLFAYCTNNPIRKLDYNGTAPGDLFNTVDDAAVDFAIYTNSTSISEDREYASFIYPIETPMIVVYSPKSRPSKSTHTMKFVKRIRYTYIEPVAGTENGSHIPADHPLKEKMVALIHTHGKFNPKYGTDQFSPADWKYSSNHSKQYGRTIPIYLATPAGTLRKYDPTVKYDSDYAGELISDENIPYDPNHRYLPAK